MLVVVGVWFALAGGVAALAGLAARHRSRRLRRRGVAAWALAVRPPVPPGEPPGRPPGRTLVQYALPDGRVLEGRSPGSARKSSSLAPGEKVLIWYDPGDPQEILVYGHDRMLSDLALVTVGALFIVLGGSIALGA
ncbi:MAG TPA: DUF3592 domain-containing protein [Streptosporangiaceae bacterium]|jgi:hypothetical protein